MPKKFQPSHRTFQTKADFPVVLIDRDERLPKPVPSIQWLGRALNGESELELPEGTRFLFGLTIDIEDYRWHYFEFDDMHERFQVAFLGKLKDWPCQDIVLELAKDLNAGVDDYVALLTCGEVIVPETLGPSTFAAKVILLADEGGVVIVPQNYQNLEVLKEEIEKSRKALIEKANEQGME